MKKYLVIMILASGIFAASSAQILSFGIKGGLNYSKMKFDKVSDITVATKTYNLMEDEAFQGFHIGLMGRLKLLNLFVQPELLFNTTGGKVLIQEVQGTSTVNTVKKVKYNKIDLPVLAGMKFGPARINAGPVASVVLSSKSEISDIIPEMETTSKGATIGFQAGVGLDILKMFTFDLRYEGGLSKLGDKLKVAGQNYPFDSRDSKWLLSVGYFF